MLASAAQMKIPPGLRWELIVVDNSSSDNTTEVVSSFAGRLPIRCVREDAAGLSHARNRGVAEARGRYICWTDDDVLVDEGWLAAYAAAFERHPNAAIFAGRVTPVLEPPTPPWFARNANAWPLSTVLAKRDWGNTPMPLELRSGITPWGANYAIRMSDQQQVAYEAGLGVSPYQRRVGEEAEAIYRLLSTGSSGWSVPDAIAYHVIPPQRQKLSYIFEYYMAQGETVAYMEATRPGQHHQSVNTRNVARTQATAPQLYFRATIQMALFASTWLLGFERQSLQFLVRAAFSIGAARA